MPKLSGLFDYFDNLDQIPLNSISRWLSPVPTNIQLENFIANRILYPQTVSQTPYEVQIDLAILREAVRLNGPRATDEKDPLLGNNAFLNLNLRKIMIPAGFERYVPDVQTLAVIFVDALLVDRPRSDVFEDLWTIVLNDDMDESLGSVLLPRLSSNQAEMDFNIEGRSFRVKPGSFMVVPCATERCKIAYKLKDAKALGQSEGALEIYGGRVGLIVDARMK